ncbi:hypothetical protein FN846DRAFT_894917 [Sphaerosporella brunnea]|uniref:Uncharacterized protein n=1 Tax=Sphaerosporella brunnea TaxID=1250544 RepID=A0A5J5EHB7_9PEZI|nr:hypothetical protein FN846DRAFT_894917 [Sphaerosporella brunnea]
MDLEKPAPRTLDDDWIAQALRLAECEHKEENGGLSTYELETKTAEQRRRDGIWISRWLRGFSRHAGNLPVPPDERKDGENAPVRGLHAGNVDDSVEAIEYLGERHNIPHAPLRPDVSVDSHVSATRRINNCYKRKLVFPHAKIPKTFHCDLAPHPVVLSERIQGEDYRTKWGEASQPVAGRENISGTTTARPPLPGLLGLSQANSLVLGEVLETLFPYINCHTRWGIHPEAPDTDTMVQKNHLGPWGNVRDMAQSSSERQIEFYQSNPRTNDVPPNTWEALSKKVANHIQEYGIRDAKDELDPTRPFVLDHGALSGAWNIVVQDTALVGVRDFTNATYVPYSTAISDLTNQTSTWLEIQNPKKMPTSSYVDIQEYFAEEEKGTVPFDLPPSYPALSTTQGPDWRSSFAKRGELRNRWGVITWEDLVHGDRFDDLPEESDEFYTQEPAWPLKNNYRIWQETLHKEFAKSGDPDVLTQGSVEAHAIARLWFYHPVLFLVSEFVETFLQQDPLGKWQDPLLAELLKCNNSKGPSRFAGDLFSEIQQSIRQEREGYEDD